MTSKSLALSTLALLVAGTLFAQVAKQPPQLPGTGRGGFRGQGAGPGAQGAPGGPGGAMRIPPVMSALDADGDGVLSSKEIRKAAVSLRTLDANKDGDLTGEEMQPAFGGPGGPGGPGGGPGGPGGAGGPGGGPGGPGGAGGPGGFGGGPGGAEAAQGGTAALHPGPEGFVTRALEFDKDNDGKLDKDELAELAKNLGPPPGGPNNRRNGRDRPQQPN
jgi:hypothetical protein